MKIGDIEISTEELNNLDENGAKAMKVLASFKTTSGKRKPSINGAPLELEGVTVTEEKGKIYFRHSDYKTRSKTVADLVTAKGYFEAEQIQDTNKKTGTRFVSVNEKPLGENFVVLAEKHNFI